MRTVTTRPGVYRMFNEQEEIIYVGKASNLKNRLSSYFQKTLDNRKTQALVSHIANVQTTVTASVSTASDYPRLSYQRGARKAKGKYIGPYPSASSVKRSLRLVQKLFRVRQCEDSYFNNRSRPCLQYQIKRCTAPCADKITTEEYRQDVDMTIRVLEGKTHDVVKSLAARMDEASEALDFETAARLRDQIGSLKAVSDLSSDMRDDGNADYVAVASKGGQSCVQVFFVRNGINLGNKAFYPTTPAGSSSSEILNAFIAQFYLQHDLPKEIICSEPVEDAELLQGIFTERLGSNVSIVHSVRADRAKLQSLALTNAEIGLATRLASRSGMAARLEAVRELVELDDAPSRMECFDISHTMGEATVASCVVFNAEGPLKSDYRRFNIEDITPGDDYAAMRQALTRRYTRMIKEQRDLPDILFIDGGKGQIGVALEVMADLQIDSIQVVGVSKGPDRRPGDETLILCRDEIDGGQIERQLTTDSPALLLIQQIRDEAHRFAITGHRGKRAKKRQKSVLEDIKGLGPKRRKVEDISAVPGISSELAARVYDELHPNRVLKS